MLGRCGSSASSFHHGLECETLINRLFSRSENKSFKKTTNYPNLSSSFSHLVNPSDTYEYKRYRTTELYSSCRFLLNNSTNPTVLDGVCTTCPGRPPLLVPRQPGEPNFGHLWGAPAAAKRRRVPTEREHPGATFQRYIHLSPKKKGKLFFPYLSPCPWSK